MPKKKFSNFSETVVNFYESVHRTQHKTEFLTANAKIILNTVFSVTSSSSREVSVDVVLLRLSSSYVT